MKIAKELFAVSASTGDRFTVKFGKEKLAVVDFAEMLAQDGTVVGYTKLEPAKNTAVDRITIGNKSYLVYLNTDILCSDRDPKYCICSDDEQNEWVLVMPFSWEPLDQNNNVPAVVDKRKSNRLYVLLICLAAISVALLLAIFCGSKTQKIKNPFNTWIQKSTQITKGGDVKKFNTGAKIKDDDTEITSEDILENDIANDAEAADIERKNSGIQSIETESDEKDSEDNMNYVILNPESSYHPERQIEDTEITVESDAEDDLYAASFCAIPEIILTDEIHSFIIKNNSGCSLHLTLSYKGDILYEGDIENKGSEEIELASMLTKSCTVKAKYVYTTENTTVCTYTSKVPVTVK